MKPIVIPTVFARSKEKFSERFKKLIPISKEIQIDFMGRSFVGSKGIPLSDVPSLKKYSNTFEAHLMVSDPEQWISGLKKKGFKKVIFHYEALKDTEKIKRLVFLIKTEKMNAFIAFNPETNFNSIIDVLEKVSRIDGIQLMGVRPGKENQELVLNTVRKVRNIRREFPRLKIQIDGGVTDKTAGMLVKAGATLLCSGSFIARARDPKKALEKITGSAQ